MDSPNSSNKLITCPRKVTSRHKITYKKSKWRVHQFKIVRGEVICTVAVLQMNESLLLWIGSGISSEYKLNEVALGMPGDKLAGGTGLASALLGSEGAATAMARRLAALLKRPVYFCSGSEFDKFSLPLVEQGLIAEIKSRPECF